MPSSSSKPIGTQADSPLQRACTSWLRSGSRVAERGDRLRRGVLLEARGEAEAAGGDGEHGETLHARFASARDGAHQAGTEALLGLRERKNQWEPGSLWPWSSLVIVLVGIALWAIEPLAHAAPAGGAARRGGRASGEGGAPGASGGPSASRSPTTSSSGPSASAAPHRHTSSGPMSSIPDLDEQRRLARIRPGPSSFGPSREPLHRIARPRAPRGIPGGRSALWIVARRRLDGGRRTAARRLADDRGRGDQPDRLEARRGALRSSTSRRSPDARRPGGERGRRRQLRERRSVDAGRGAAARRRAPRGRRRRPSSPRADEGRSGSTPATGAPPSCSSARANEDSLGDVVDAVERLRRRARRRGRR